METQEIMGPEVQVVQPARGLVEGLPPRGGTVNARLSGKGLTTSKAAKHRSPCFEQSSERKKRKKKKE